MKHEKLIEKAKDAIEELFSDMSVSQSTTLKSLEELRDEIDNKIDCIVHDLKIK